MAANSYRKYYQRQSSAHLGANHPGSTARAFDTRNNLQHLIDVCPQHRIQAIPRFGADSGIYAVGGRDYAPCTWLQEFIYTHLATQYAGIHLRVTYGTTIADAGVQCRVRLVPAFNQYNDLSAAAFIDVTDSTTSDSDDIESYAPASSFSAEAVVAADASKLFQFPAYVGNVRRNVPVMLMRLEITLTNLGDPGELDEDFHVIHRVLVRESA